MTPDLLVNALDAVSDAVVVCDREGTVLHANRRARELFGPTVATRAEVMRHPLAAVAREQRVAGAAVVVVPRPRASTLAERERQDIEQALAESCWRLAIAARKLGISRTTLWRRLKQYQLCRPEFAARRSG